MKKEIKVKNPSVKEPKKKSNKVKKASTKEAKIDEISSITQKTKAKETNKKCKFTLDIVELLNLKIKNKYYCLLLSLFLIFIFFLTLNIIGIVNKSCCIAVMSTHGWDFAYIFIFYTSILMNKHIFTNKAYKFITFIICLFISFFIITSFVVSSGKVGYMIQDYKCSEAKCSQPLMKPIIYLYPESKIDVSVELGNPERISHSYPKYEKVWNVIAQNNGEISYNERQYYGLYWEGKEAPRFDMKEGFVVKGSSSAGFLEEKLSLLGLNEREANEFIIYWLPKLESNPYNFIKFATLKEQNEYMPLNITPKPETIIRVMMAYKGLSKPIDVKEQIFAPTPERKGFVAIEWGGTEMDGNTVY